MTTSGMTSALDLARQSGVPLHMIEREVDKIGAEVAHETALAVGRQPRYYSAPAPGTDPARGSFTPVERPKPRKRRGRR